MPIYEFHCSQCDRESEILVRTSDWKGTRCPHCGSAKLMKKLSVFSAGPAGPDPEPPPCSGNPNACGRCAT